MNLRTSLTLLSIFLYPGSSMHMDHPHDRVLLALEEYSSHRHWENGEEKNVYPVPTAAPTRAPAAFIPVEGDDDAVTDDVVGDDNLAPEDGSRSGGGLGPTTTALISVGGAFLALAALYLRRKKEDDENEADVSAAPSDMPESGV